MGFFSSKRTSRTTGTRFAISALALLAATALAGCHALGPDETGPRCPSTSILADVAHDTHYAPGPGRDLTDIDYQVDLTKITGECRYAYEGRVPSQVTVLMKLNIRGVIGPANRTRKSTFTYFVAIVDRNKKVVAREEFDFPLKFEDSKGVYVGTDELEQVIPLTKEITGPSYQVFVGLKLDPESLSRNRAKQN
jgi:hypothetical protein